MDTVDITALELEVDLARARLARILTAADAGLASVRRRSRLRHPL